MTDLATITDVTDRSPRTLSGAEQTRATVLLGDASALIRTYTRQTFTAVSGDVVELRPVGMELRLPERPVTDVNSVVAIGWGGLADLTMPAGSWGWDGIDIVKIAPFSSQLWLTLPDVELYGYPDTYRVDYDHGAASVPDDVIAVCCGMVLRVINSPSASEGLNSEKIGEYSYGMQQGGGGTPGPSVRLSEVDKDALSFYRRKATTIQVRL